MTTTYRDQRKPDPNPGYQRSETTVSRDRNGDLWVSIEAMKLVELKRDYEAAGISWAGEGK